MSETKKESLSIVLDSSEKEKENEITEQSLQDFIVHQAEKYFVENIPIEPIKELPGLYVYYLGAFAYGALVAIFVYFFYVNYIGGISQAYIALDNDDGECNTVPISITNSYLADSDGHWFGEANFVYSSAQYELVLNDFKVGKISEYTEMMDFFKADLDFFAVQLSKQSAAENLIFWMSYINYYSTLSTDRLTIRALGDGNVQYFQLTGDPSVVFNKEYTTFSLSNENGTCEALSISGYVEASGTLTSELNYPNFVNSENCLELLDPSTVGYAEAAGNQFDLVLDVRSFSSAMSVNLGMVQLIDLRPVEESIFSFSFRDVTYNVSRFFDFRYPTMDPIYCGFNVTETPGFARRFCTLAMVETVFMPVFNHLGARTDFPEYCNCATEAGNSQLCNEFRMMLGLLFYKSTSGGVGNEPIEEIIGRQMVLFLRLLELNQGYDGLNRNSYKASFLHSADFFGNVSGDILSPQSFKESFSFCDLGDNVGCGLVNYFEYEVRSHTMSEFQFQLNEPSCVDTIRIPDKYWDLLANDPPTELVQDYVECVPSFSSNVVNALGVASGNTSIAMIVVFILLIPVIYLIMVGLKEIPTKPEYSDRELQEALNAFSLIILRIRDGKTNGLKSNGVMRKLVNELIQAANNETATEGQAKKDTYTGINSANSTSFKSVSLVEIDPMEADLESVDPSVLSKKQDSKVSLGSGVGSQMSRIKSSRVKMPLNLFSTSAPKVKKELSRSFSLNHQFTPQDFPTLRDLPENSDLMILNLSIRSVAKKEKLTILEFKKLLHEMLHCFHNISLLKPERNKVKNSENAETECNLNPEQEERSGEYSEEFSSMVMEGKKLSQKLAYVNFDEFLKEEDSLVFLNLVNIISMHASVVLNVEMGEIVSKYGKTVAYDIGGRVLTYSDILELSHF